MIMPARLGELVRPYLLQQKGASFSSVFGAVLVERFFDLSGLLLLLGVVLLKTPDAPPKFSFFGEALLVCLISRLCPGRHDFSAAKQNGFDFTKNLLCVST